MRTDEAGWSRVGESANGGETPEVVGGWLAGDCKTFTGAQQKAMNEWLNASGYTMRYVDRTSAWSHKDGSAFEVAHVSKNEKVCARVN
jgi:hypothetical protein